jgi:hypothetical protein
MFENCFSNKGVSALSNSSLNCNALYDIPGVPNTNGDNSRAAGVKIICTDFIRGACIFKPLRAVKLESWWRTKEPKIRGVRMY